MDVWVLVLTLMSGREDLAYVSAHECRTLPIRLKQAPRYIENVDGERVYVEAARCLGRERVNQEAVRARLKSYDQ